MGREKSLHGKTKNGLHYFLYPQKEFVCVRTIV